MSGKFRTEYGTISCHCQVAIDVVKHPLASRVLDGPASMVLSTRAILVSGIAKT